MEALPLWAWAAFVAFIGGVLAISVVLSLLIPVRAGGMRGGQGAGRLSPGALGSGM